MIDTPPHGNCAERSTVLVEKNASTRAAPPDLIRGENRRWLEVRTVFKRKGVQLELPYADGLDQQRLGFGGHCRSDHSVAWQLNVRMRLFCSDWAPNRENPDDEILKLAASAARFSTYELWRSCSRRRQRTAPCCRPSSGHAACGASPVRHARRWLPPPAGPGAYEAANWTRRRGQVLLFRGNERPSRTWGWYDPAFDMDRGT